MPNQKTRLILIAMAAIIVIIGMASLFSPPKKPEIECYESQAQTMSVQSVADLLNIPLVELAWIPDYINTVPQVTTRSGFSARSVTINYVDQGSPAQGRFINLSISHIGAIQLTKMPPICSWKFTPTDPIGTDCRIDVDSTNNTLWVNIDLSSEFSPEDAIRVLEGIRIVEPYSVTNPSTATPSPTNNQ